MPELPEVETMARDLEKKILGLRIKEVEVSDAMVVRSSSPKNFIRNLENKKIIGSGRRGKAIILKLFPKGFLIIQPVMTGQVIYGTKEPKARVIFALSNGQYLNYNDQRRFGRLNYIEDLSAFKYFKALGLEPLDKEFSCAWFLERLKQKAIPIKTLLMNQAFLSGIGNIYASEILFRSKINPRREAKALTPAEIRVLYQTTLKVLKEAILLRGSSVNTYRDLNGRKGKFINRLKVYGRDGQACLSCRQPIERIVQSGRSTFFCRICQS
ncbi:MAG: DNA-formamidopyrimidine glycosylase [Candidatus Omnitrophota bacterium]